MILFLLSQFLLFLLFQFLYLYLYLSIYIDVLLMHTSVCPWLVVFIVLDTQGTQRLLRNAHCVF